MWLHTGLNILICRQCEAGQTSQTALGHLKIKHNQTVRGPAKEEFTNFCKTRGVHVQPQDVPIPKAGGPRVQGIAAPSDGFSCRADGFCEYSVRDRQTMLRHSREKHGGGLVGTTVFENTLVQYLFRSVSHVYFEVDPALTLTAGDNMNLDVRRYLRGAFLIGQEDNTVTKQDADRDRPPLLRITMWDTFQEEIRKDPAQRHAAHLLKAKHEVGEGDGIFVALDTAVKTYHAATRVLVNGCSNSFTIRKVLLNGPNFSPDQ
jgi:Orsellinic acid/F9775 biosynthesis cluster protein D